MAIHNIPALIFCAFALVQGLQAWQFSTTTVNLLFPPPLRLGEELVNGNALPNYTKSPWPCNDVPVPADITRSPFPISGGRIAFSLFNNTPDSLLDYQYQADFYLGQISLGNGTYSTASQDPVSNYNEGFAWIGGATWRGISTGQDCSDPIPAVELVAEALGRDAGELIQTTGLDLRGLNATIGVRINLFGPYTSGDENIEEMYQVCGQLFPSCSP